ncbi:MAG: insulinase family protein [Hymenobacter sp.]
MYWVDYNMVQAEILFLTKGDIYNKDNGARPVALYNEYFGGGMGSIVFQDLRESKALAYSAMSRYANADKAGRSNYIISYIGTQSDKLPEAMSGMESLLTDMPAGRCQPSHCQAKPSATASPPTASPTRACCSATSAPAAWASTTTCAATCTTKRKDMTFAELQKFQQSKIKGPEPGYSGYRLQGPAEFQGIG